MCDYFCVMHHMGCGNCWQITPNPGILKTSQYLLLCPIASIRISPIDILIFNDSQLIHLVSPSMQKQCHLMI